MLPLIEIALGGVLLIAGRKLYWLLAAAMGFVVGLFLTKLLLPNEPEMTGVIIAVALAALGAILMVVFQKALIGLVGFLAGGIGAYLLLTGLTSSLLTETWMAVSAFIVGGVVGALLLIKLFDLGLIVLSSVIGAYVLMTGLGSLLDLASDISSLALIVLIGIGIVIQMRFLRH